MTQKNGIYKCEICGNVVEVHHTGAGELVCCGQPMNELNEKKEDEGNEKHVPVVEKKDDHVLVKIGETPHPMEEKHYIEWVEVVRQNGRMSKIYLTPTDEPEAKFECMDSDVEKVRIYCNIHGLWSN